MISIHRSLLPEIFRILQTGIQAVKIAKKPFKTVPRLPLYFQSHGIPEELKRLAEDSISAVSSAGDKVLRTGKERKALCTG
jgi:hypothetical protein